MAILSNFPVPAILSVRRSDDLRGGSHRHGRDLDAFLLHVSEAFSDLDGESAGDLLSLRWIGNLLDILLSCFEGFRAVLGRAGAAALEAAPMARILADFFDRGVKALDVCSAARDGAAEIRERRRHLGIVTDSICGGGGVGGGGLSEGRLRRARKALAELALDAIRDEVGTAALPRRRRSFGKDRVHRRAGSGGGGAHRRSQSWSVSVSWSAARQQLQGAASSSSSGLAAPRGHEMVATEGLAVAVYAMGQVVEVVMWALAAALHSGQGLGGAAAIHYSVPRGFSWWSAPIVSVHERILDEARKKKEDKQQQQCSSSDGLLKELREMERRSRSLMDLIDGVRFPVSGEEEALIKLAAQEVQEVKDALRDDEIDRVEKQIREVFHRILRLRREGLDGSPKFSIPFQ